MIPKTIHYCWFGRKQKPELLKNCIKSWHEKCPDYKIIEWNEDNYDTDNSCKFVKEAYAQKKYAFVSDFVRYDVVYRYGGIYFDCDVKLLKSIDDLLQYNAFFGFERTFGKNNSSYYIATGLGFGAVKESKFIKGLLDIYSNKEHFDEISCTMRETPYFLSKGVIYNNTDQFIDDNIKILNSDALCPKAYKDDKINITDKTYSIHFYTGSWKKLTTELNETIWVNKTMTLLQVQK